MTDKIHELLGIWFGHLGTADLPSSDRTNFWFGESDERRAEILQMYRSDYDAAVNSGLTSWLASPRGVLALIILLDQFSRYIYRQSPTAFENDARAQEICLQGIQNNMDQSLTLIERVFFYMPLVHSEDNGLQEKSIRLYQNLVTLSMPETTQIYQLFLAYAYAHFRVVKEFGRFPQRNVLLQRPSTEEELAFLKNS